MKTSSQLFKVIAGMEVGDYFHEITTLWPLPGSAPTRELVDLCRRAVVEHPESSVLWYDLGIIMERCDDGYGYRAADYLRCYEKSVRCDPNYADAYEELGYVLDVYFSDYARAERTFRRAIELGAEHASYFGLARVLAQMGRTDEAMAVLSEHFCPFHDLPEIQKLRSEILDGDWYKPGEGEAGPSSPAFRSQKRIVNEE
jgi:tetratricopeptide (TPR) repeat protein